MTLPTVKGIRLSGLPAWPMVAAVIACLWAVPLAAQNVAGPAGDDDRLLSVETLGLDPTVGKTGDIVAATFRLRFGDLVREGREVLILEDRMAPDRVPLAPFEAVALEVDKQQDGERHVWTFTYRVRVIGRGKGLISMPSVPFYWLVRDVGQPIEEAQVRQTVSAPLRFRYVTTVTDDPVLAIRDQIELGRFDRRATLFRAIAWGLAPLPLVWWMVSAALAMRRRRVPAAVLKAPAAKETEAVALLPIPPTTSQARRQLKAQLPELAAVADDDAVGALTRLVMALRAYLAAEQPELNPGDTARDIRRHLEATLPASARKNALEGLAALFVDYQDTLEGRRGSAMPDLAADRQRIESLLADLGAAAAWRHRVTRLFRRGD